ncbi:MAG: TetR/AcrR family transcriptional regulator [Myxococcota bacterium]|nr:TetR/AcrR family transcriptional regulator [Myxococcota bacterium]
MTSAESPGPGSSQKVSGSEAVRAALIEAAGHLLGEIGPRNVSVREIAQRAGVNHGQIHHYFGGKRGLLEAAIRELAREHYANSLALAGGEAIPAPLSLSEDRGFFRALCQSVMDGDIDLVRAVESDNQLSVPRRVLRQIREQNPDADPLELKARFSILSAMELGWVAFEELMFLNADVQGSEREELRGAVKRLMENFTNELSGVPNQPKSASPKLREGSEPTPR